MSMKYKVCWLKTDEPQIKGEGEWVFDLTTANAWRDEMNKEYPWLYHYVVGKIVSDKVEMI